MNYILSATIKELVNKHSSHTYIRVRVWRSFETPVMLHHRQTLASREEVTPLPFLPATTYHTHHAIVAIRLLLRFAFVALPRSKARQKARKQSGDGVPGQSRRGHIALCFRSDMQVGS